MVFKANRWYAGDFGAARIIYLILILAIRSVYKELHADRETGC